MHAPHAYIDRITGAAAGANRRAAGPRHACALTVAGVTLSQRDEAEVSAGV